jgi:hypothetical protein
VLTKALDIVPKTNVEKTVNVTLFPFAMIDCMIPYLIPLLFLVALIYERVFVAAPGIIEALAATFTCF